MNNMILLKKTELVILVTIITMLAEIYFGITTHSMALLADGFHMGTHALALGLTFLAYFFARKFANSEMFEHGTEKIKTLAAYTSSIFLGVTGFAILDFRPSRRPAGPPSSSPACWFASAGSHLHPCAQRALERPRDWFPACPWHEEPGCRPCEGNLRTLLSGWA